jgi:hypothetical protein
VSYFSAHPQDGGYARIALLFRCIIRTVLCIVAVQPLADLPRPIQRPTLNHAEECVRPEAPASARRMPGSLHWIGLVTAIGEP